MELRRDLLGQAQPAPVVLERVVGVDPALHADLGRAEVDRLLDRAPGSRPRRRGRRRASGLPWPKPQKAQPTTQTLVKLMLRLTTKVADVAGELRAQLVGGDAHLLDHLGARLGEQRRQLLLAERHPRRGPSRSPRARARDPDGTSRPPARAPRGMKRPVLELHDVEDALLHPLRVEVLRVGAEALGQRVARAARGAFGPRAGSGTRCSGEMWSPLADRPPRSVAPRPRRGRPTSRRGSAGPGCRRRASAAAHSATSRFMSSSVTGVAHSGSWRLAGGRPASSPTQRRRALASAISATSRP